MVKRDGTEVLRGTASVGRRRLPTALDRRLRDELKPFADPVILRDVKVGMKTPRQTVRMDFDQNMGELYPFSLRDKLKVITEPSPFYEPERAGKQVGSRDHPVRDAERAVPVSLAGRTGCRSRARRSDCSPTRKSGSCAGPLFVGESYDLEREVVALSASRRTESVWVRTTVFDRHSSRTVATMLLNLASMKESFAGYAERARAPVRLMSPPLRRLCAWARSSQSSSGPRQWR